MLDIIMVILTNMVILIIMDMATATQVQMRISPFKYNILLEK